MASKVALISFRSYELFWFFLMAYNRLSDCIYSLFASFHIEIHFAVFFCASEILSLVCWCSFIVFGAVLNAPQERNVKQLKPVNIVILICQFGLCCVLEFIWNKSVWGFTSFGENDDLVLVCVICSDGKPYSTVV